MTTISSSKNDRSRLDWLDVLRLLSAVMILGIHWLRACYAVRLLGAGESPNLVWGYQSQTLGLGMLPYVLIAGPAASLSGWLTNAIGLLGGFGWEAVSVLIIVSGFSLTLSMKERTPNAAAWRQWFGKRAERILVPFYLVALPFLVAYMALFALTARAHGGFMGAIHAKLVALFHTPVLGIVISHVTLFDPFARFGSASFFAPAWWFIPAILLAYIAYPAFLAAARRANGIPLLIATAFVSAVAYRLSDLGLLQNETWFYIVLHESFNFALGIVTAVGWLRGGRARIESILFSPWTVPVALVLFATGNVANWSPATRPVASILYGPGLVLLLTAISKRIERWRIVRTATRVDAYDLYLVHQPFAFPLALATKFVLRQYAVFGGWFVFLAVAASVALVLSAAQKPLLGRIVKWRLNAITDAAPVGSPSGAAETQR